MCGLGRDDGKCGEEYAVELLRSKMPRKRRGKGMKSTPLVSLTDYTSGYSRARAQPGGDI